MHEAIGELDLEEVADAIQSIGFECTNCGACCRGDTDDHVATVFPDEVRRLQSPGESWRDVARPLPFGLDPDGVGTTLEWAIQTASCGDCRFLDERDGKTRCTRYADRPSICRTYPFTLSDSPEAPPQGEAVDAAGPVIAHECEGLGRAIDRADALDLARELLDRATTSIEEAAAVRAHLNQADPSTVESTTVIDSEGVKRADGTALSDGNSQR